MNREVLELEAVTPENYSETVELAVKTEQEHFISPVVKSLADAFVWGARVRVARESDRLVGFVMVYPFEFAGDPAANIVRLMIDRRHQGRGLGRSLLSRTMGWIATFSPRPSRVRISTFPDNSSALRLYRSAGFEGSELENGEVVLWYTATERE